MSISTDFTFRLGLYESKAIVEIQTVSPGTYIIPMSTDGNSILSTLFVNSCPFGASVKVNYYDFGPGDGTLAGERVDLESHDLVSASELSDRIIVTKMHNKPRAEIIVSGGNVSFGLYITVVSNFPVDLKGSILNGDTAQLGLDGGLPISVYDSSDGKFYLLQGSGGALATGSALTTGKTEHAVIAAANVEQSHTFVAGTCRFIVKARTHGKILMSHDFGNSGVSGLTIHSGAVYESPQFMPAAAKTIYFQSPVAGLVVEIESWS